MSEIKFTISQTKGNTISLEEKIKLSSHVITGNLKCYTGEQGEFWVSIIPSLNVSGYAKTEKESLDDLKMNVLVFCEDLFNINESQRKAELRNLGWTISKLFKKQFSKSYIDENGVLQNFDFPERVKKSIFEAV